MDFLRKTVVITGAASGIGFLCSKNFAENGANIAMLDVNTENLGNKVNELRALSYDAIGVAVH